MRSISKYQPFLSHSPFLFQGPVHALEIIDQFYEIISQNPFDGKLLR